MSPVRGVVGVLAVQGDVREHVTSLQRHGVATRLVRRPRDLEGLAGIVLPGGESSTMLKLLTIQGLEEPLGAFLRTGHPVLATCAGLILCAREVVTPEQRSFGALDVKVARNGWGRQIASGTFALRTHGEVGLPDPMDATFIRAPRIIEVGPRCEILATRDGEPVLVRQDHILGASFHPELDIDHAVTHLFCRTVYESTRSIRKPSEGDRGAQREHERVVEA